MIHLDTMGHADPLHPAPGRLRDVSYGFLYWLAFLLVLEPGNVLHAVSVGHTLDFNREALRIAGAALLGSSVTPVVLALTRRFPIMGPGGWGNAWMHVIGAAALAFGLILVSCLLAAWVFTREPLPSVAEVREQLSGNWLLLIYAICAFTAIAHAVHFIPRAADEAGGSGSGRLTRISVKTRGRLRFVDIASIEWIETQGNYLALHDGSNVHLIRETLVKFEARLDPGKFVRIHRRVIVAVDCIRELRALANGDSIVILLDGRELRASRRYREAVRRRCDP